jgi:hypothetical protein
MSLLSVPVILAGDRVMSSFGSREAGAPGRPGSATSRDAFVDANMLIRHLTGDPSGQAARATRLL